MPTLTELPLRMRSLARDESGLPIPWFAWTSGQPWRTDRGRWLQAVREQICWVCGQRLGEHTSFVLQPIEGVSRKASDPPSHKQCAQWRAQNCPEGWRLPADDLVSAWPGVVLAYTAVRGEVRKDGRGGLYVDLGPASECTWWRYGREATREEVIDSVEPAFIDLERQASPEGWDGITSLYRRKAELERFYPRR